MKNELEKLEQYFNEEELNDSWYYKALQQHNKPQKTTKCLIEFDEKRLKLTKTELINQSIKLVEPNMHSEWLKFIKNFLSNNYYLNIIEKTISIIENIDENNNLNKTLINESNLSSFELTICQEIINRFFITKINLFNIDNNKKNSIVKIL